VTFLLLVIAVELGLIVVCLIDGADSLRKIAERLRGL
jgi:hypothetical protein